MTFIQFVYDMEGSHMTFIQFVYDMEGSHITSSAVYTRWWPKTSKSRSGHGLTNRIGPAGPALILEPVVQAVISYTILHFTIPVPWKDMTFSCQNPDFRL